MHPASQLAGFCFSEASGLDISSFNDLGFSFAKKSRLW